MRPLQGFVWGSALAVLAVTSAPAHAAWNNVFQVCCNSCGTPAPTVASAACPDPCAPPPTTCTTRYVQRSYYQPVTSYRTSYYYQPVTTYRTSYYYEPVTSYRYSCYYDPCTCSYQSVAQPVTSYRLRSQCCPVTSYLQRTCTTPVTSYQLSYYYEPVTTCCTSTAGAAVAAPPAGATTVVPGAAESRNGGSVPPPPPAGTTTPPPGTSESRDGGSTTSDSYKLDRTPGLTPPGNMPRASDSALRNRPTTPPPAVRFDRIASLSGQSVEGRVVDAERYPLSGVRVLFVSVEKKSMQETAQADRDGVFRSRLSSGGWLVYTYDLKGRPVFSRRIEVPSDRGVTMTLVNR